MTQQPTQMCDNCFKQFPQSKIATHFGYCRRNIKKCTKCGEMYDINFTEQHQQEYHKLSSCKYCRKQFKPNEVNKHQNTCDARTQFCQYCDLDVPMRDYPAHLRQCQARTKQCEKCRKPIANKQYLIHTISCPGMVEQIKPTINSNLGNRGSDYESYLKEQQRKDEIRRNQYKPSYQQPKRQISRGRQTRPSQQVYSNNLYTNNNQPIRQVQIKKQSIIPNKPSGSSSQNKAPLYTDINVIKNAGNVGDKRIIQPNYAIQKQRPIKVQSNMTKNIGSGKIIENKYVPSVKPASQYQPQYQPSVNTYGIRKQVQKVVPPTNNVRSYQHPQMDINTKPIQQAQTNNYPKVQQNYKKQIPSNKDVYIRNREQKPSYQIDDKRGFKKQDTRKYQQPQRNIPKQAYVPPAQQYRSYQPVQQYVPHEPTDTGIHDHDMDEQLQKAIMASLGNMGVSSPKGIVHNKSSKPQYRIDDIPAQLLQTDMMNESFYGKQAALMQQFEKNKKRR